MNSNGTVVAWGRNDLGQTNVPANVTNAIAIAAGGQQSLALLKDGTIVQWGRTFASVPFPLTNGMAIASGTNFHLALLSNGTLVAWGNNAYGQTTIPSNATNIVAIAAGGEHALALREDGNVIAWGGNDFGETNVPANLTNAMAIAAGYHHSIVLKNDRTILSWGDNSFGQTNDPHLTQVKLIGAGPSQTLASVFSPLVQYPVDVSKDLLLIYNTNSVDSSNVCAYYLQHRPMVGNANVLGIGCRASETVNRTGYTNTIRQPILDWLKNNPTKRPQYWVLFLDIPSRINVKTNEADYPGLGDPLDHSVSFELYSTIPVLPFITHINMNGTNDCKAYIDRLEFFGTNYCPGHLIIAPTPTNYPNTNYIVDNVRTSYPSVPGVYDDYGFYGPDATNGLLAAGVLTNQISYLDGLEQTYDENMWLTTHSHLTNGFNLAGYISWGCHSSLMSGYATNGVIKWTGASGWWLIETVESQNGWRFNPQQGDFVKWFSANAFGGTNYSNTPIGAATQTDEPGIGGMPNAEKYFRSWASGRTFAETAWNARDTEFFQAVGDPFVKK